MSRRRSGEAARRIIDDPELLTRTSWVDAGIAYRQVCKGRATGNKRALWLRWRLQTQLFKLGCFIDKHCGKVLFLGLLLLALCCVGLKTTTVETNVDRLWVEVGGRLQKEQEYSANRGSVLARRDKVKDKNRKEMAGEGTGTTYELVIQTPKEGQDNLLNVESLLKHFDVIKAATEVTVDMYGQMWHFKDLCFASSFPSFDDVVFDRLLEQMVPCMIMTPLDCFWEGSKLLGPDHGVFVPGYHSTVKWTNLDPIDMIKRLKELGSFFPADAIMDVLKRAGVGAAYQDRPCLDPTDIHCPQTAPNKKSKLLPDVGYELTGGCTGFASKYMQWEESLIVGGVHKNKTGYMDKAEAFQSILLLLGSTQLYEYHKNTQKVHEIDWTSTKAHKVLTAWQHKFKQTVLHAKDDTADSHTFLPFVSTSLLNMLAEFSKVSMARVSASYVLMLFYACVSMWCCQSQIRSQSAAAMTGVVLIALSVAAGLGVCSVIGIQFNATTTQIIPFLALGLGVDDMFFILHIYRNLNVESWTAAEHIGECLKRTGVSVLLTSVSSFCAFFAAAIIPIPALRAFVLQAGILVIFNVSTILLIFPAVLSIDLTRKRNNRLDVLCCFKGTSSPPTSSPGTNRDHVVEIEMQDQQQQRQQQQQQQWQQQQVQQWQQQQQEQEQEQPEQEKQQPEIAQRRQTPPPEYTEVTATPPPSYSSDVLYHGTITRTDSDGGRPTTELAPPTYQPHGFRNNAVAPAPPGALPPSGSLPPSATSSRQCLSPRDQAPTCLPDCCGVRNNFHSCSLTWFTKHMYAPLLEKTPIKVFVIVCCLITLVISIVGVTKVREGLDLTDVVPKGTTEYDFLEVRAKYFGFYTFSAVTKGNFDYSTAKSQKLMYEYHSAFQHVDRIIKKKDGGLPDFWLKLFRDWLLDMQKIFRRDLANNCFHDQGWHKNASDDGILGYKLMVQTGDIINSVDRDLIHTGHLVDDDGIINEKAFYVYMSAWTTNDALAFVAARPSFEPKPREWLHDSVDKSCTIEKSQPFKYTEFPFYLEDMVDTDDIIFTIKEIRAICEKFTERGLPNYPSGIPFTYWEQYINLRYYLFLSLLCIMGVMFIVLATVLLNLWAAAILVAVLTLIVVELFGFMGLIGIKLSAVPAVILVMSVGIGVEFTVHLLLGFLTTIGSRNKRMRMSLEHVFSPVINGALSTFLGIVMMAGSEFDFIIKYFFAVLSALMVIGTLNGLVLLPVVLSICGPPAEVVPTDKTDRLSPPTPEPSPPPRSRRSHGRNRHHGYPRVHSDISLTTITEESSQYSSSEVIVPHIVMETTVNSGSQRNNSSSRNVTSNVTQTRHLATLRMNVKLELHTPLPGAVEQEHSYYKSTRRKDKDASFDSDSDCSNSSA